MSKKETALQGILQQRLLPLYYHADAAISIQIMQALYEAGIRTVEYTNRGEQALTNFKELKRVAVLDMPDMQIGIGTIKNKVQAAPYIDAGADYIICPSTNEDVAEVAEKAGLLWVPGCMTPTEIATAENAGAALVKIFPGNILGPAFVSAVKELFPGMKFMPTGGVEAEKENLKAWFLAGVSAVGMGSKLISKTIAEASDFKKITMATNDALQLIQTIANE